MEPGSGCPSPTTTGHGSRLCRTEAESTRASKSRRQLDPGSIFRPHPARSRHSFGEIGGDQTQEGCCDRSAVRREFPGVLESQKGFEGQRRQSERQLEAAEGQRQVQESTPRRAREFLGHPTPSHPGSASDVGNADRLKLLLATRPGVALGWEYLFDNLVACINVKGVLDKLARNVQPADVGRAHGTSCDLLPISVDAVRLLREPWVADGQVFNMVLCMLVAINALYCNAWRDRGPYSLQHPTRLSMPQLEVLDHLVSAAKRWKNLVGPSPFLGGAKFEQVLSGLRLDYAGELVGVRRRIVASLVIPCWPSQDQAAVVHVEDVLLGADCQRIQAPMLSLKPEGEWPERARISRVHADKEEWTRVVHAAYQRGMMEHIDDNDVFRHQGEMVLNGAMAVDKWKKFDGKNVLMQRFISIFTPINDFFGQVLSDDKDLPYIGQLTTMELEADDILLVDSEDFESCFNLFVLPPAWRCFFAYAATVPGWALGRPDLDVARPSMRVVPMGFTGSVSIVQALVRQLVFHHAAVDEASEVRRGQPLPSSDSGLSVVYLDSFDYIRALPRMFHDCHQESAEHRRFIQQCQDMRLPLNVGKTLLAAASAPLQGSLLDGHDGLLMFHPDKGAKLFWQTLWMASLRTWTEASLRQWAGRACFAAAFRRPLLSVLQNAFHVISASEAGSVQVFQLEDAVVTREEMLIFAALVPLCFSNLRAPVAPAITCSDASEWGGGSASATSLKVKLDVEDLQPVCDQCNTKTKSITCSWCQRLLCSVACMESHLLSCPYRDAGLDRWLVMGDAWGKSLTHYFLQMGVPVAGPLLPTSDVDPFFTDLGRQQVKQWLVQPGIAGEIWLLQDDTFELDVPLTHSTRGVAWPMGKSSLPSTLAKQLRQCNALASFALRRACDRAFKGLPVVVIGKSNSLVWNLTLARKLLDLPSVKRCATRTCLQKKGLHVELTILHNGKNLSTALAGLGCRCSSWTSMKGVWVPPSGWSHRLVTELLTEWPSSVPTQRGDEGEMRFVRSSLQNATSRLRTPGQLQDLALRIFSLSSSMVHGAEKASSSSSTSFG